MFNFKKKILNPIAGIANEQIDSALKLQSVADKIERLLSIRASADKALASINTAETIEAQVALTGSAMLSLGAALGLLLIPTIALACLGAGLGVSLLYGVTTSRQIKATRTTLEQKIDSEVRNLARAQPQEAAKSPRFLEALAQTFNGAVTAGLLDRLPMPVTTDQRPTATTRPPSPMSSELIPDPLPPFP